MQVVFTTKSKLGNTFQLKNCIPKDCTFSIVYKFYCALQWVLLREICNTLKCKNGWTCCTIQKMIFSIKDFLSKCDQIWSHLLKKSLMKNFIFCAVLGISTLIKRKVKRRTVSYVIIWYFATIHQPLLFYHSDPWEKCFYES